MQRTLAIAALTLKAAFRYRLVVMLAVVLLAGVAILPFMIKDDGTARGFTQIVLTYTLMLTTGLLGFATLWLACGTLARDVEECQMQMVVVKPIARWQIWLGKLLGILAMNAILLTLAGGAVFASLKWRAQSLPEAQQTILYNEIFVARASATAPKPDYEAEVNRRLAERIPELQTRLKSGEISPGDLNYIRQQMTEDVKAQWQLVPPGVLRRWHIDLGMARYRLQDRPLYLRVKFNAAQPSPSGTYQGVFVIGDYESPSHVAPPLSLAPDTFHELELPPNVFDENGRLTINFINWNETALLFPLDEPIEVLYREGGFGLNFGRGLGIIFCWLTLLAMIGLASASFLSFPVAAFFSIGVLIVGFSSGTIGQVIEQGTVLSVNHETGRADAPALIDYIALPVFRALLYIIKLVFGFSPIDSLSTGRSITWGQLGLAFSQICLLMGGLFALLGITTFTRRELATAQGTQ